jgi:hypothetical protein
MLFSLSALLVSAMPSLFQSAVTSQAAPTAEPILRSLTGRDSTRALKVARRAQGDFESMRRRLLPFDNIQGAGCEAIVGQYCYRQQITAPPPEAPVVVAARTRLLMTLDSLGTLLPGDRWIVGQRVRYLMEAGRPLGADSIAVQCAGTTSVPATASWCLALAGYTAQQLGNYPRADAAFTSALEQMPEAERCKWQDLAVLIGRSDAGPYRRGGCEARDTVTAGFWRLVQPLYLTSVNDLRTEFFARITRMYIEQGTRTAMSDSWGSDDRDALLRYGVPLWFAQGERARGQYRPQIAGFRREPAFNFFPDAHVFGQPNELAATDWSFASPEDRPTYAPLWAVSFLPITDHQVALFRRGDSAFIVAAFDADDGSPPTDRRQAGAFAAVVDRGGVLTPVGTSIEGASRTVVSTLVAPWRPLVISLEILNKAKGSAGRARFAPKLPAASPRLGLSDLLLYTPRDSAPKTLSEAIPRVLYAMRAPMNRQIGVFWETYGVRPQGERFQYALLVAPEDESLLHRALAKLHVVDADQSLTLQWQEVPTAANGIASRGLTVDLSRLRPGRYSVRLMLTSGKELPIVAERSIDII